MSTLTSIWEGQGSVEVKDTLRCPLGRFLTLGVRPGDTVLVALQSKPGEVEATTVIQVDSEDSLFVRATPLTGAWAQDEAGGSTVGPRELIVAVQRELTSVCPVCAKGGHVSEANHVHCPRCKTKRKLVMSDDGKTWETEDGKSHCEECVTKVREQLIKSNDYVESMTIFGGKRTVTVHARTVRECDYMQEWQDRMIIEQPQATTQWVLDESARMALGLALDDDGAQTCPRSLVPEGEHDDPYIRLPLISRHFKNYNSAVYRAMLQALDRLDSLIEDACADRITDDQDDQAILELADALATSDTEVVGNVTIWGGLEMLRFAAPSQADLDEANAFAEAMIQANKGRILDGRSRFLIALARLAAGFRGDGKRSFDEHDDFNDRLNYLFGIPMPMYYLYIQAGNVFNRRVAKASELEVLGNS